MKERPDLAQPQAGKGLFYQFGVGLAILATVDVTGRPRVQQMSPLLREDGLFGLITRHKKRATFVATVFTRCTPFPALKMRMPST
jgi:hypothetical protein